LPRSRAGLGALDRRWAERGRLAHAGRPILAGVSLSDTPRGRHGDDEIPNVRVVVLHMIEETAAHSGHLEIARELLDGKTGLSLR
jgi:Protein of unknown function (DUF664)